MMMVQGVNRTKGGYKQPDTVNLYDTCSRAVDDNELKGNKESNPVCLDALGMHKAGD